MDQPATPAPNTELSAVEAPDPAQQFEDPFETWGQRYEPSEGFISLREAHQRWGGWGIERSLAELLLQVPCFGAHMHGAGGELPPGFLTSSLWHVDVEGSWAREVRHPKSLQYALQVCVTEADFEGVCAYALKVQRGDLPPAGPVAVADNTAAGGGQLQRPAAAAVPSLRCPVCDDTAPPSEARGASWCFMGDHQTRGPVYVCTACVTFIRATKET